MSDSRSLDMREISDHTRDMSCDIVQLQQYIITEHSNHS